MDGYRNMASKEAEKAYFAAVRATAENAVGRLKEFPKRIWKNTLETIVKDGMDLEPYIIDSEKQIHTLLHSKHPAAGIVDGTGPIHSQDLNHDSSRPFPFNQFAEPAFTADVWDVIGELLDARGIDIDDAKYNR